MAYFVKFGYLEPEINEEQIEKINVAFIHWLLDIRAEGKFVLSGGFESRSYGMTILEADSMPDAMKIFNEDPFNKVLTSWDIKQWNTVDISKP
jgi:uncharacterized protein YciI